MHDLNVLALVRGEERFIFVYDDQSRDEILDAIRDAAADPQISLSWFDAAVLTERARQQALRESSNISRMSS
jgi:tripartite-type tricarboxylate transporter receptor subunit TctC